MSANNVHQSTHHRRTFGDASLNLNYPAELPIIERREEIVQAIREHQVLVITGETGSGKSTQIPKMCIEAGRGVTHLVGCTQPRRIAAITLASRVAEELGTVGFRLVGHKIRFQDRTSRSTRIKFMTDGILLAEVQKDRLFKAYDTLVIDEAHERTLNIDFLLGLIKKVLPRRPDLKVIITSATIDPEKFSRAFGDAPIIEVSGRTYPVDVKYRPIEVVEDQEDQEETTYIDQTVAAVHELKTGPERGQRGDILVFMPTESDIRETVQRLEEKRYLNTLVFPLFGRMASADQQRIFALTPQDKIVVATNVAETSITIPRIRYVVDTGLARISQYNARSRTQSLPVLPVSQASADQRKGRCGRVASGVCIRLYSKDDYLNRSEYTSPEIQRSNLAEVILRMLYLRIGNIQDFPFLDPPSPPAIKDGFAVLTELGAIDEHRRLTPLGRMMARLPLDPRLSRMLLEAQKEGALRELMILAAVMSVQDPRERPMEKEEQADRAHAVFRDPRSDFVALLKIWHAGFEQANCNGEVAPGRGEVPGGGSMAPSNGLKPQSTGRLRKFCREHFLSFRRMREWRDVYEEIRDILEELGELRLNETPASYEAIHRSILSGYLSHIALRKEKNMYLAAKNRQAMIFPGSGLFNRGGQWVVAAELVLTSRLYARTAACIEPEWIEEFGKSLCRYSHFEPHWEKRRGQVTAFERVTLYGLTIVDRRKVNYGRINPEAAREIFIRSALVEGDLPGGYPFMEHNRKLIKEIEDLESKARRRDLLVDDETIYNFYDGRVPALSDIRSFNKFLKDRGGDSCLRMTEGDLLQTEPDFGALDQFPDTISLGEILLPLSYSFHPGEEDDGVTATIPVHTLPQLSAQPFQWLVPGLLPEKVALLLKSLPKSIRKQLVPVGETAQRLLGCLSFGEGDLYARLSRCVQELTGVRVPVDQWDPQDLPAHLLMRFEVVGPDGSRLGAGRDLEELQSLAVGQYDDGLRREAKKRWERTGLTSWSFGDLPPVIEIGRDALGLSRYSYPGLEAEWAKTPAAGSQTVAIRLFDDPEQAVRSSFDALMVLYQSTFASELKQLRKEWVLPERVVPMVFFLGDRAQVNARLQEYIMRELFDLHVPKQPDRQEFEGRVRELEGRLALLGREMIEEVAEAVEERENVRACLKRFRKMASTNPGVLGRLDLLQGELEELMPHYFPKHFRRSHVSRLPRYLKALQIRAERVYVAPEKDRQKAEQLAPYKELYDLVKAEVTARPADAEVCTFLEELRGMLEEFKISLFAPEIKTQIRISAKRLEEKWQEWLLLKQNRR